MFNVYRSTDSGAPSLCGVAGSLTALLDACLINGYGSLPAAGWTKPFIDTGKAVYRNAVTAVARSYYRVTDTGTTWARIRGYDAMSSVDAGTGEFPTSSVIAGDGIYAYKSSTADTTARPWILLADERTAVMALKGSTYWQVGLYMGDGISDVPGDTNFAALCAFWANADEIRNALGTFDLIGCSAPADGSNFGLFIKGLPGVLGSKPLRLNAGPNVYGSSWNSVILQSYIGGDLAMPSGGAIHLWPYAVKTYNGTLWEHRGTLRFLYVPRHQAAAFAHGDTFSGTGALSGKRFEVIKTVLTYAGYSTSTATGALVLVTQNPD
ncbi:MAG TPA: hypothetical protein PKM73_07185 [Verrucomicrobiota bacterium]|nr:hypothetical protein [Verrucomicrobiota bacterium]HNU50146.1 hypothetical protein [Verrucomicrobiota bacterium]